MGSIRLEYCERVAFVRLNKGTIHAIDLDLVHHLNEALEKVRKDSGVRSLILGSTNNKFFSIGFDIPHLFELEREDFSVFYRAFNRLCIDLYTFPKPTIAAITGHAIAGGCILALCCDYRIISEGRKLMGLNEIKLGVPVPYPGDWMVRYLIGIHNARKMMDLGEFYEPADALRLGIVDDVFPLQDVRGQSLEKAKMLGSLPPQAFQVIKQNRVERVTAHMKEQLEEKEKVFIECWYAEETRERLKEAMKTFYTRRHT